MLKIEGEADLTFLCLQTNVEIHVFKSNSKFLRKAIHFAERILKTFSDMGPLLSSNNKQCIKNIESGFHISTNQNQNRPK